MPAISPTTRQLIKAYLEVFIENTANTYKNRPIPDMGVPAFYLAHTSSGGQLKPFHAAIIPEELLRISAFERGFSTRLGTTYEECARLIALEHHAEAKRSYDIKGRISLAAINEIERQVALFEHAATEKTPRPTFEGMIEVVLNARDKGAKVERSARADLYIKTNVGQELFFELKSPMPNKGQCLEVTQRLLRFHLLRNQTRPTVQAYFAMAYNPYGPDRMEYKWTHALNYTPFDQAILIGHEFWTLVGGPTAFEELLDIYQEVGNDKTKYILDTLAFGF